MTVAGTRNNHGLMLNAPSMAANLSEISGEPDEVMLNPMIKNAIKAMVIEGMVVMSMYLMWSNKSAPAMAEAKFVVSESGEILSPK